MKKEKIVQILTAPVIVLFFYAAVSKLADYDRSHWEMRNQIFPAPVAGVLTWLVPLTELAVMALLLFLRTRKKGLQAAACLLAAFTLYIGIVLTGTFGKALCSCGGILRNMPYSTHLFFNLAFIALSLAALALETGFSIKSAWYHLFKRKEAPGEST